MNFKQKFGAPGLPTYQRVNCSQSCSQICCSRVVQQNLGVTEPVNIFKGDSSKKTAGLQPPPKLFCVFCHWHCNKYLKQNLCIEKFMRLPLLLSQERFAFKMPKKIFFVSRANYIDFCRHETAKIAASSPAQSTYLRHFN